MGACQKVALWVAGSRDADLAVVLAWAELVQGEGEGDGAGLQARVADCAGLHGG